MDESNHTNVITVIIKLIQAHLKRLSDILHLASLEAKLAVKTSFSLAALFFIVCILLTSSWLSLLFLLCSFILSLGYSLLFSALVIASLNILLLIISCLIIWKLKQNLFFPATRKEIHHAVTANKGIQHE